jgi:hypothetical protein
MAKLLWSRTVLPLSHMNTLMMEVVQMAIVETSKVTK